jgi:nucleoid-associated protein YgaU
MANQQELQQKYQPVINTIQQEGGQLQSLNVEGNQLALNATVPSEDAKNHVWDAIKSVDSSYSDLKHNITVDSSLLSKKPPSGEQEYTVQSGDSLSKISQRFYGNANRYMEIAKANNIADPNKIAPGQKLKIPA